MTKKENTVIENKEIENGNIEDMDHDLLVEKINTFTKLEKERELNDTEMAEREKFRFEYLRRIRQNLRAQLNTIKKN